MFEGNGEVALGRLFRCEGWFRIVMPRMSIYIRETLFSRGNAPTWKRISMISFRMGRSPPWWIPMPRLRRGRMDTTCGRVLSCVFWFWFGVCQCAVWYEWADEPPKTKTITKGGHITCDDAARLLPYFLGEGVDGVGEDLLHQLLLALLVEVQLGHLERVRLALPAVSFGVERSRSVIESCIISLRYTKATNWPIQIHTRRQARTAWRRRR